MPVSDEDLDRYRRTLRRRDEAARAQQKEAHRNAWHAARQAASVLEDELGAERVILFGSVAREERLSPHSDLDLAVEGLAPRAYLPSGRAPPIHPRRDRCRFGPPRIVQGLPPTDR